MSQGSRRKLLLALGAGCLSASLPTLAQQASRLGTPLHVGIFRVGRSTSPSGEVFVEAMRELGWAEGRNITYERVYAENDETRLPALAAQLVARAPALIHTLSNVETLAVFAKTRTIPIVFATVAEPIEAGLIQSLARPGGNVTGVANIGWELGGKRMQILREALPKINRVGVLVYPRGLTSSWERKLIDDAAGGMKVVYAMADHARDLDAALARLAQDRVEALLPTHTLLFQLERKRILQFAEKQRIPVIGFRSEFSGDGALMSYSAHVATQVRQSARLADKVLKGAKPADIPVERPTKVELVINMKTAKALGLTIPQSVLLQATEVIR